MSARLSACLLVVSLLALPVDAQQREWTVTGEDVDGWEYVDDEIREYMQTWAVPGAVLSLAVEGRLVFAKGYTWDTGDAEIIQPESLFRIASASKPITSVAIHQLIERGLLSYDTRLVDVLDLEPPPGGTPDPWLDEVTIDHLLYHTGGWDRNETFDPMFHDSIIAASLGVELPISKRDVATFMTGRPMQFEPGSRSAYSNYGYCLLGLVIEEITGRDYSEWVGENVFQPIGVGRPRLGHSTLHERAPGEVRYVSGDGTDPYGINVENMDSHGGWILAAPDYLRFVSALFDDPGNSPLLSRASIDNMVRVNTATSDVYARGWVTYEDGGATVYEHSGSLPGTLTQTRWAEPGIALAAFINTRKDMADLELTDPTTIPQHDLFPSVGIIDGPLGAALAESWIPVVASGGGAGGSVWRSDVALLNRSARTNPVTVRVEMPGLVVDHEEALEPDAQMVIGDIVAELGLGGSGSLRVFSAEPLSVASRTFNTSPDGTFGQSLGGVSGPGGLRNGQTATLLQLREDSGGRSNIGVLNAGRRDARVQIVLYDGSGAEVARFNRTVGPHQITQVDRPFMRQGGRTDIEAGYARITVLDGEHVTVYGSVIDAFTNDPTTIPMKTGGGATALSVAAVARGDGAAGSVWRSDLAVLNPGPDPVRVRVERLPEQGTAIPGLTMDVSPGEQRLLVDVLGAVPGSPAGSGWLRITAPAPIFVGSRTYNQSPGGTFGQHLDGAEAGSLLAAGDRVWLPQLQQNDAFRTNIGITNTGGVEARVKLRLHDGDGELLATLRPTIDSRGRLQLQEPFDRQAGRTDITRGYAVVEVLAGDGVDVYGSVIDNRTNDPTTVAMVR